MGRHVRIFGFSTAMVILAAAHLGACGAPCSFDTDCKGDQICQGYRCVAPDHTQTGLGLCSFDWECGATETCRSGTCLNRSVAFSGTGGGSGGGAGGGAGGGCGTPSCIGDDPTPLGCTCSATAPTFACTDHLFNPDSVYLLIPVNGTVSDNRCWLAHWRNLEERIGYVSCSGRKTTIDSDGWVVHNGTTNPTELLYRFEPDATYKNGTVTACPGAGAEAEANDTALPANSACTSLTTTLPIKNGGGEIFYECSDTYYYGDGSPVNFNISVSEPGYLAARSLPIEDAFQYSNQTVAYSTRSRRQGTLDHIYNDGLKDEDLRLLKGDLLGVRGTSEGYRLTQETSLGVVEAYRAIPFPDERYTYIRKTADYTLPAGLSIITGDTGDFAVFSTVPDLLSAIDTCGCLFIGANDNGTEKVVRMDPAAGEVVPIWDPSSTTPKPVAAIHGP